MWAVRTSSLHAPCAAASRCNQNLSWLVRRACDLRRAIHDAPSVQSSVLGGSGHRAHRTGSASGPTTNFGDVPDAPMHTKTLLSCNAHARRGEHLSALKCLERHP